LRTTLAAVGAAIVVIVVVVALGLGWLTPSDGHGLAPAHAIAVQTSLAPRATFFGDPVAATVTVAVDPRSVAPDSVRVAAGFGPYVQLRPPTTTRAKLGRTETLTYRYELQCLSDGCLPDTAGRAIQFPTLTATAKRRGGGPAEAEATWKPLTVAPRVPTSALRATPSFRRASSPPPASFGLPAAAADVLTALGALLALTACVLGAFELRALLVRRRAAKRPPTQLELAVAYAREAADREPADRRRALGLLSRALRSRNGTLAETVDDVAWAEGAPSSSRTLELAEEARE
jgi:hypothetical protein